MQQALFDAIGDENGFDAALSSIAEHLRSENLVIEQYRRGSPASEIVSLTGGIPNPALLEELIDKFALLNPRAPVGFAMRPGVTFTDDDVGLPEHLEKDFFYQEFLAPNGLRYFLGCKLDEDADRHLMFTLQRSREDGAFTAAERGMISALFPALRSATRAHMRVRELGRSRSALLNAGPRPVAILDGRGQVRDSGDGFTQWLESCANHDPLTVLGDAVRQFLARPDAMTDVVGRFAFGMRGPVAFRLSLLRSSRGQIRLLCEIDDPRFLRGKRHDILAHMFELTRRECDVAVRLGEGLGACEIAAMLRISHNTVRSHLALLRAKLDCASQPALVARIQQAWRLHDA